MKYLLDTHALLWFINDDNSLSEKAKSIIENSENQILVSIASFWEIAIKRSIGKLDLKQSTEELFKETQNLNFILATIDERFIFLIETLPLHHRDPFDRILIAQAIVENLEIISIDEAFDAYPLKRIW